MKKHVYRKGDRVRILSPFVVDRVGYPKSVYDYYKEEDKDGSLYLAQLLLEGVDPKTAFERWQSAGLFGYGKVNGKVRHLAAYLSAKADGFGGRERSIHYKLMGWWEGAAFSNSDICLELDPSSFVPYESEVIGKRVIKTGTYYPPYVPTSYWPEDDYEPGGLEDVKTHVIITTTEGYEHHTKDIEPV